MMRQKQHTKIRGVAAVAFASLLGASVAQSQTLYQSDFTGNSGAMPANWDHQLDSDSPDFAGLINDTFQIEQNAGALSLGLDGSATGLDTASDYTVTTEFMFNVDGGSNNAFVYGRSDGTTTTSGNGVIPGYQVNVRNNGSGSDELLLVRDIGGNFRASDNSSTTTLDSTTFSGSTLPNGSTFTLELDLQGTSISGTLYDGAGTGGTVLASVSGTDSTYTSGSIGLGLGSSSADVDTLNFDNISVVPEPGTYALLAGIAALTGVMLRRRQRS